MNVFVVRREQNPAAFVAIGLLALCIPVLLNTRAPISATVCFFCAALTALIGYLAARTLLRSSEFVALDRDRGTIVECTRDLLLRKKLTTKQLPRFVAVSSHLTFGKNSTNAVSLLTAEQQAFCLFSTQPITTALSFWSLPRIAEAPKARAMREELASYLGVRDLGFQPAAVTYKRLKLRKTAQSA